MADEFIKGLGILMTAGFGWMVLAGWYNTPSFNGDQLIAPDPTEGLTLYDQLAVALGDALFWFAILGALTFWVFIPMYREGRSYLENRSEN